MTANVLWQISHAYGRSPGKDISDQIRIPGESEGQLTSVYPFVDIQGGLLSEAFKAYFTQEWLLSCIDKY